MGKLILSDRGLFDFVSVFADGSRFRATGVVMKTLNCARSRTQPPPPVFQHPLVQLDTAWMSLGVRVRYGAHLSLSPSREFRASMRRNGTDACFNVNRVTTASHLRRRDDN